MNKQWVKNYIDACYDRLAEYPENEILLTLKKDAVVVQDGKQGCWICESHGTTGYLPDYLGCIRPAVDGLDLCEECHREFLDRAECRVCGESITAKDAEKAYRDAGHTENVSLECMSCHPEEDGIPYWTER